MCIWSLLDESVSKNDSLSGKLGGLDVRKKLFDHICVDKLVCGGALKREITRHDCCDLWRLYGDLW